MWKIERHALGPDGIGLRQIEFRWTSKAILVESWRSAALWLCSLAGRFEWTPSISLRERMWTVIAAWFLENFVSLRFAHEMKR